MGETSGGHSRAERIPFSTKYVGKNRFNRSERRKGTFLAARLRLFFQAERAQRSFLSGGLRMFFLENVFTGGRGLNGGSEPLPEYFSIPSVAYSQMHSLPRLHLSDSFGMFSNLHLFFRSGRSPAERPVCDSTRALREFSLSGRINDSRAGSGTVSVDAARLRRPCPLLSLSF